MTKSTVLKRLGMFALLLTVCCVNAVRADATLTYELTGPDAVKQVKKFSMARFFVRIDDPADADDYLLFQAGKFFPLFAVDTSDGIYTRLTAEVTPYMSPHSRKHHGADDTASPDGSKRAETRQQPAPKLKATNKTRAVAGIECRVVHEMVDGKPAIEHCMANSARLGITDRELISLSRTFAMARSMGYGWLGTGTTDEEFVSLQSRDLRDNRALLLTSVSTRPLAAGYLRIPREFRELEPGTENDDKDKSDD